MEADIAGWAIPSVLVEVDLSSFPSNLMRAGRVMRRGKAV